MTYLAKHLRGDLENNTDRYNISPRYSTSISICSLKMVINIFVRLQNCYNKFWLST